MTSEKLSKELDSVKLALANAEAEKNSEEAQKKELQEQLEQHCTSNNELQTERDQLTAEKEDLRIQLEELTAHKAMTSGKLSKELDSVKMALANAEAENQRVQRRYEDIQAQLGERLVSWNQLQQKQEELIEERDDLKNKLMRLSEDGAKKTEAAAEHLEAECVALAQLALSKVQACNLGFSKLDGTEREQGCNLSLAEQFKVMMDERDSLLEQGAQAEASAEHMRVVKLSLCKAEAENRKVLEQMQNLQVHLVEQKGALNQLEEELERRTAERDRLAEEVASLTSPVQSPKANLQSQFSSTAQDSPQTEHYVIADDGDGGTSTLDRVVDRIDASFAYTDFLSDGVVVGSAHSDCPQEENENQRLLELLEAFEEASEELKAAKFALASAESDKALKASENDELKHKLGRVTNERDELADRLISLGSSAGRSAQNLASDCGSSEQEDGDCQSRLSAEVSVAERLDSLHGEVERAEKEKKELHDRLQQQSQRMQSVEAELERLRKERKQPSEAIISLSCGSNSAEISKARKWLEDKLGSQSARSIPTGRHTSSGQHMSNAKSRALHIADRYQLQNKVEVAGARLSDLEKSYKNQVVSGGEIPSRDEWRQLLLECSDLISICGRVASESAVQSSELRRQDAHKNIQRISH
eukprot:TRINITY_DN8619_c1_g1_i4.p1 TRINITY_DN8619_c1_g1~~TRINITY_DN8619_c1_g1_i4.p1  ORF type:complete len:727 (+),score=187.61 TRINITY_DN8619_c1_g1_i4:242-2182(+)